MAVSRQRSSNRCIEETRIIVIALRYQSRFDCTETTICSCCIKQARRGCNKATTSFWLYLVNILVLAASSKETCCGCNEAPISLRLHRDNNLVVGASSQPPRCGCIEATISLCLYQGSRLGVSASKQQSRCGCIKACTNNLLHCCTEAAVELHRSNSLVVAASRQQSHSIYIE